MIDFVDHVGRTPKSRSSAQIGPTRPERITDSNMTEHEEQEQVPVEAEIVEVPEPETIDPLSLGLILPIDVDEREQALLAALAQAQADAVTAFGGRATMATGQVNPGEPTPRFWMDVSDYQPYFDEWRNRPEYTSRLKIK